MRVSQARSLIRWSKSIAQPSVTALSPSRFSSIFRSGEVNAKCSVWPASWKSANQSSGPPWGWITSMTLSGISIGAQNARGRLRRPLLDVQVDVLLRIQVDAEVAERPAQRRHHPVGGKRLVPARAAEEAADVVTLGLAEADADVLPQRPVHRLLVQALRRVEKRPALGREAFEIHAEAIAVELEVRRRAEVWHGPLRDVDGVEVERVQVLLGEGATRVLQAAPLVAVGGVRDRRRQHPVADRAAVHRGLERRLELGDLLRVLAGQLTEVALAAEAEELPVLASTNALAEPLHRLDVRQVRVPLVDRAQVEVGLQARVVEVVLLVELGDEAVGAGAVAVELAVGEGGLGHSHLGYAPCASSRCRRSGAASSSTSRRACATPSPTSTAPRRCSSTSRTRPPA